MSGLTESVAIFPTRHDGLRHFVDRTPEVEIMARLLRAAPPQSMLFFHGAPGIGKSTLLEKLRADHCTPATAYAWLDFQYGELYTVDQLIEQLRDQLGDPFSATMGNALLQLANAMPQPLSLTLQPAPAMAQPAGGPSLQIEATVEGVGNGSAVAIGQNIIQLINSPINFTGGMGHERYQQEEARRHAAAFRTALAAVTAQQPLLLFFDSIDYAPQTVLIWLRKQLLQPIQQGDRQGEHPLFVALAGDFAGPRGHWLRTLVDWHNGHHIYVNELTVLQATDIAEYWVTHRQLARQQLPASLLEVGASPHLLVGLADLEMRRHNGHGG